MGTVKCTSFEGIKRYLQRQGGGAEKSFIRSLPADMAQIYPTLLPINRLPIDTIQAMIQHMADFLFSGKNESERLINIGVLMATQDMNGIYKFLLRFTTIAYAMQKSAMLWKTFHDQGDSRVEEISKTHVRYIISGYAEMPKNYRTFLSGYILGLLNLCGAKNATVVLAPHETEVVYDIHWQ